MITEKAYSELLDSALDHKRRAIARRARILELIEERYGMVYGIAHVVHDLRCEAAARIAEVGGDTRDLRARDAINTAADLMALCPDQEVME